MRPPGLPGGGDGVRRRARSLRFGVADLRLGRDRDPRRACRPGSPTADRPVRGVRGPGGRSAPPPVVRPRPDDLARGDWATPRPAWLRGTITQGPRHIPSQWPGQDEGATRLVLAVSAITPDGERWLPASGRVLVYVSGECSDLRAGDPVFAAGNLSAIPGPLNPGEADRRARARAEGVRLRMSVGDSASVWLDPDGPPDRWAASLGRVRSRSEALLASGLAPDVSALASALLLGRREAVDPDRQRCLCTDRDHPPAGDLRAPPPGPRRSRCWPYGVRVLGMGRRKRAFATLSLLGTVAYAILVGLTAPSVARSAAMTVGVLRWPGWCDRRHLARRTGWPSRAPCWPPWR